MPRFNMNWIYGIIIVILVYLFFTGTGGSSTKTVDYTTFETYVKKGYATGIIAQKDKGVLQMGVKKSTALTCSAQTMSKASEACPSSAWNMPITKHYSIWYMKHKTPVRSRAR